MYNITLTNKQILKIFNSDENRANGTLTLTFLASDYNLEAIIKLFDVITKDDLKRIIKTTSTGNHVATFEAYTDVVSISFGKTDIQVEKEEDIPTLDENGQESVTTITTIATQQIDIIIVTLKYEDPTKLIVEKLNQQINPTINIETCTLAELKHWQKSLLNNECTRAIEDGVDVQLSDGNTYHFSYKLVDQINYTEMYQEIEYDGYTKLPYHPDNGDCTIYSATDIKTIITNQRMNKFYMTTKCNAYHRMIDEATTKDDVLMITWGSELSPERQQTFDNIISGIAS